MKFGNSTRVEAVLPKAKVNGDTNVPVWQRCQRCNLKPSGITCWPHALNTIPFFALLFACLMPHSMTVRIQFPARFTNWPWSVRRGGAATPTKCSHRRLALRASLPLRCTRSTRSYLVYFICWLHAQQVLMCPIPAFALMTLAESVATLAKCLTD